MTTHYVAIIPLLAIAGCSNPGPRVQAEAPSSVESRGVEEVVQEAGSGDNTISASTDDATYPEIELLLRSSDSPESAAELTSLYTWSSYPSEVKNPVNAEDVLWIEATGLDSDGGLKELTVEVEGSVFCDGPTDFAQRPFSVQQGYSSPTAPGGAASTTQSLTVELRVAEIFGVCSGDEVAAFFRGEAWSEATNFAGGTTGTPRHRIELLNEEAE